MNTTVGRSICLQLFCIIVLMKDEMTCEIQSSDFCISKYQNTYKKSTIGTGRKKKLEMTCDSVLVNRNCLMSVNMYRREHSGCQGVTEWRTQEIFTRDNWEAQGILCTKWGCRGVELDLPSLSHLHTLTKYIRFKVSACNIHFCSFL